MLWASTGPSANSRSTILPIGCAFTAPLCSRAPNGSKLIVSGCAPINWKALRCSQARAACVCSEDAAKKKPHPAPLQLALKRLRRDPQDCVYVGDTAEDIEMARRAGVRAIGVLGPFPTAARLRAAKPEVLLNSVQELPRYLRSMA